MYQPGTRKITLVLAGQATQWATRNRGLPDQTTPTGGIRTSNNGRMLNPRFVEALMGFPIGWSDCAPLAVPSSTDKRPLLSTSCGSV